MAGLRKQTKLNIADTNLALFGSDIEKKIKLAAAKTEKQWVGAGKEVGVEVWRVYDFAVHKIPNDEEGQFFEGDSYIVLNTYKVGDNIKYNVHFWLGKYTSQDEAGTAAYKTVELDDYLSGLPVEYREVQGYESTEFLALFKNPGIRILSGGKDSAFKHVGATKYTPRLYHIKGVVNNIVVREVPLAATSLNSGDVYVLDLGLKLYQWNGQKSGVAEKSKGGQLARAIDDERGSKVEVIVLQEGDKDKDSADFFTQLNGKPEDVKSADQGGQDKFTKSAKSLWKLSDSSGKLSFEKVSEGTIKKAALDSNDVFVFDSGSVVFVWVGAKASKTEKASGLQYAQQYLITNNKPVATPIARVLQGGENEHFESLLSN